jgi:protein KRI1
LKKHILNSILDPAASDDEGDPPPPTYVQEQAELRSEMVQAFRDAVTTVGGAVGEEEDDLLVLREMREEDGEKNYTEFLKREAGAEIERFLGGRQGVKDDDVYVEVADEQVEHEEEMEPRGEEKKKRKRKKKGNGSDGGGDVAGKSKNGEEKVKGRKDKEREDQDFLIKCALSPVTYRTDLIAFSYILNRGWVDKTKNRLPTYKEVIGDGGEVINEGNEGRLYDALEEEDKFDEVAEEFETSYNFRFEEPYVTRLLPI